MTRKVIDHFWIIEILQISGDRYDEKSPHFLFPLEDIDISSSKGDGLLYTKEIHEAQRFDNEKEVKEAVTEYQRFLPSEKGKYIEKLEPRECIIFGMEENKIIEKIIVKQFNNLDIE